jgi:hypothetical protein
MEILHLPRSIYHRKLKELGRVRVCGESLNEGFGVTPSTGRLTSAVNGLQQGA